MISVEGTKVHAYRESTGQYGNFDISKIHSNIDDYKLQSAFFKVTVTPTSKIFIPTVTYVPIRSAEIIYDIGVVTKILFADNYSEQPQTIYLDNKIYTINKGYISADNLGSMDVLFSHECRPCKIISKERVKLKGHFFKMELKYGNNIFVNGLAVIPK